MSRLWEKCFWNRSLAGQLITFMLVALVLSQAIGFLIYYDERGQALRDALKEEFLVRSASVAQLLETTPEIHHPEILRAVATNYHRFWVTAEGHDDVVAWKESAWERLDSPLPANPALGSAEEPPVDQGTPAEKKARWGGIGWDLLPAGTWPLDRPARFVRLDDAYGSGLIVQLQNGDWLNAAMAKPTPKPLWMSQSTVSLAITALLLSLIAVLLARRIARPMHHLAQAAEALGRGEETPQLCEEGPDDIRRTAEAFNRMQERLRRFVDDRTAMLAAIGHDLRTPITSLRLRAEFVTDREMREKILATLDEMQMMTEATLAFAREEAAGEPTRLVDLSALVESLCSDLADLEWDVSFTDGMRIPYRCRPAALRRAMRNLIENAVRYGERARVALTCSEEWIEITIDDDGRGIPTDAHEQVFQPFVRLETSRSRATGGVGLGLSVARTILRSHGGDVLLLNRAGGGLRAVVRLPQGGVEPPSRPAQAASPVRPKRVATQS